MKRLFCAAALTALAACTSQDTIADLEDGGILHSYDLKGPAAGIAECVTGVLDRNRYGFNIQRTRNLSDGSVELLGGDSDMARDILWRGIFKPAGPAATRLDLTTKDFLPFISETSVRRQILAIVNGCAGKG